MSVLRPGKQPSSEAKEQYDADRELAGQYVQLRAGAERAEQELHDTRVRGRTLEELRERNESLDHALGAALQAAVAGERSAMGMRGYDDRLARRRAKQREDVRLWTAEVSMLRTVRERFRLQGMSRTGMLVPTHVQVGTHAMSSPSVPGAEPGMPDDVEQELDEPRVGVDLDRKVGQQPTQS